MSEVDFNSIFPLFSAFASSFANIPVDFLPDNSISFLFITSVPLSTPYIPITDSTEPVIDLLLTILALAVASIPVPSFPFTSIVPSFTPSVTFPVDVFFPVA